MIKSQKIVLQRLIKLSGSSDAKLVHLYDESHYLICLLDNYDTFCDLSDFNQEMDAIMEGLEKGGYISYPDHSQAFRLTAKGLHRAAYIWEQIKIFLLKSVIVPIVVAAITAYITVLITG